MYQVKIREGYVVQKCIYNNLQDGYVEVTEEQYNNIQLPCRYDNGNFVNIPVAIDEAEEIKKELEELDKTINRATEDLYVLTQQIPYSSIATVIARKEELRRQLRALEV